MTPEEFKREFRIGDTIKIFNSALGRSQGPIEIKYIGEKSFVGKHILGNEVSLLQNDDWIEVKPTRLPSEEIKEKIVGHIDAIGPTSSSGSIPINKSADYANNRIDAILNWLDENWEKKS